MLYELLQKGRMDTKLYTVKDDLDFLRQVSEPVDFSDRSYLKNVETLRQYCRGHAVFALAPVQIGIPKRIIYLKNTSTDLAKNYDENYDESKVLINPVFTFQRGETEYWETCQSCLKNCALVKRPYAITVEYFDVNGDKHKEEIEGFAATVLSHERDHLDGILHMDRVEKFIEMEVDERIKLREKEPYKIISKTGEFRYKKGRSKR